ncbi:MAG: mechanosensitive ion channel [Chlorobi bacterium]|nr:mechanosensitive ion channel [Chlorobiota bacterium]
MKSKPLLLILFFFIASNFIYSQADTTAKADKITAYGVTEIPIKIEEASSIIAAEKNAIIDLSKIPQAKEMLNSFLDQFSLLKKQSDSLDLTQISSVKINELYRRWDKMRKTLSAAMESITERATLLGEKKNYFEQLSEVWKVTKSNAFKKKAPKDLINSIEKLQRELDKVNRQITVELNQLLSIQTNLSEKNLYIESELLKLKELQIKNRRFLFTRNSPPIWVGLTDSSEKTIVEESRDLVNEYANAIVYYLNDGERLALGVVMIIFFLLLTLSMRHYSKNIPDDDEPVKLAFKILERPYSVAALLFLFFMALVMNDSLTSIISLRKILLLIPLLRVLLHIIPKAFKKPLFGVTFLLILKEIKINTGSETSIERAFLFTIAILSILGIIWLKKSGVVLSSIKKERVRSYFRRILSILLFLFIFILIANILGYVMLGIFLVNGIYDGIFITILLLTSWLVLNGLLLISLQAKPAQKLKMVQLNAEKIKRIFRKIVKALFVILWIAFVLDAFNVYVQVLEGVRHFLTAKWGVGNFAISLGDILSFVITIWLSVQLAKFTRFALEVDILPQFRLPRGVPGAITSLARYTIIGIGIFVAFLSAGLDLNRFTLLAGALGVGIGFGLQDLVSNFISGIILIFERPVQVGDVIVVGKLSGEVKKIGIRSSIIRTWEGAEIIIPNGHLISSEVTNWTFSDKKRRMEIPVGVKYGSDVNLVKKLLLECAASHSEVLTIPAPEALFTDFGDSALEFELRCWTANSGSRLEIESELRYRIDNAFKENNIEIPFPQRDIHIRTEPKQKGEISGDKNN